MTVKDRLRRLFSPKAAPAAPASAPREPYLTQTVTFGNHAFRREGEDASVVFVDEARGIRRTVVDNAGRFRRFPGIEKEEFWVKAVSPAALEPRIRFRTDFERCDSGWRVYWEIQPDGRYWEDCDGFGAESDAEVILTAMLDETGCFTGPFRIYSVGATCYDPQ